MFNLHYMKRNLPRCILPFLLLLTFHFQLIAQNSRTISGIIKDAMSGERLPLATITINGTSRGTTSNVDGHFSLLDVLTIATQIDLMSISKDPSSIHWINIVNLNLSDVCQNNVDLIK